MTMGFESQLLNISYRNLIALLLFLKGGNVMAKPYSLFHASLQCNSRP